MSTEADKFRWLLGIGVSQEAIKRNLSKRTAGANANLAAPSGSADGADPWAVGADTKDDSKKKAAPTVDNTFPRPMLPDCKIVHGKVSGPANHALCAKHGHVVDTNTKMIIAKNADQYKTLQFASKGVAVVAPIVQSVVDATAAIPGLAKAGPAPTDKPSGEAAAIEGIAKEQILSQAVEYLHQQYNDLRDAIQEVINSEVIVIDKLKEVTPAGSGGLKGLIEGFTEIVLVAFPHLEALHVAVAVVKVASAGKEIDEKAEAARKAKEAADSKMEARDALNNFAQQIATEIKNIRGVLETEVEERMAKYRPPPDFLTTIAKDFHKYVKKFTTVDLGIKIGTDHDKGAVDKIKRELVNLVGKWLKEQYIKEHEPGKVLSKHPFVGMGAFDKQTLADDVKKDLEKDKDFKKEIDAELSGQYTKEYQKKVLGIDDD